MTAGEVFIDERQVTDLPPKARDIAMVFQNYALYPHMTVEQNIGFGLKLRKTPADERNRRVQRRRPHPGARRAARTQAGASSPAVSGSASRWGGRWFANRWRS